MPFLFVAGTLNDPATYLTWGWLGISLTNLVVMVVTVVVFVLAVLLPFPHHEDDE
jgi:hypothetical protein